MDLGEPSFLTNAQQHERVLSVLRLSTRLRRNRVFDVGGLHRESVSAKRNSAANRSFMTSARHVGNRPLPTGMTPNADDRLSCSYTKPSNVCRRLPKQLRPPHAAYHLRAIDRRNDAIGFGYQDVCHRALAGSLALYCFSRFAKEPTAGTRASRIS